MPSLKICGKPTPINGDDLRCCVVWDILLRLLELSCIIPLSIYSSIGRLKHDFDDFEICVEDGILLQHSFGWLLGYLWVSLIYAIILCVFGQRIWVVTGWGTPTVNSKRSAAMKRLLLWKHLYLLVVKAGIALYGMVMWWAVQEYCQCVTSIFFNNEELKEACTNGSGWRVLMRILVICHIVEAISSLVLVAFVFCRNILLHFMANSYLCCSRQSWIHCCVGCCCSFSSLLCFCSGDSAVNGDFTTLSLLLNDFLGDPIDVVFSDILAAIVMLKRTQTERRLKCQASIQRANEISCKEDRSRETLRKDEQPEEQVQHEDCAATEDIERMEEQGGSTSNSKTTAPSVFLPVHTRTTTQLVERKLLTRTRHDDVMAIAEGARFIQLAVAIYTWLMQMQHSPRRECCWVLPCGTIRHCATCCCRKKDQNTIILGDNLCGWNAASLRHRAGDVEVVYAQFQNTVVVQPYCIVLDHEWRSVVVVIRGTWSLDDLVTDLKVQPASLKEMGEECGFDGSQSYAHNGILASAKWVYEDLKQHGILDRLLVKQGARYMDYQLRVVGHSLGASCACLVGLFLKSKFPALRCLCFCPAGATVSKDLADECKEYLTSFVLDSDFVPRLSLLGLEHLRDNVLEMVARIKVPKHRVMKLYGGNTQQDAISETNRALLYEPESDLPETEYTDELAKFSSDQETRREEREIEDIHLYPPGQIVHLVQSGETGKGLLRRLASAITCRDNGSSPVTQYQPLWADAVDFQEIELTSHLLDDHDPETVSHEIERVAESFGLVAPAFQPMRE